MLINSLEYLYQTLRTSEPGSLYSTDKLSFMIDANLNDARTFLVSLIEDMSSSDRAVELAYKIILLIGIARSNIEDLLIVATLLDKQNAQVDLREEIQMFSNESGASSEVSSDFSQCKISKQGRIFYLATGTWQAQLKAQCSITTDNEYVYLHQSGLGLIKVGTGVQSQMIGHVYQHNSSFCKDDQVSLLYLNGKLYARSENFKTRPLISINTNTLEEEKFEVEVNKDAHNLTWQEDATTGRHLTQTPLFSDGNYLYVVSLRHSPKDEAEQVPEDQEVAVQPPTLTIEVYDPSHESFPFVREVTLYKDSNLTPFIKKQNTVSFVNDSSFSCNGQVLRLYNPGTNKQYFFNLQSGVLIQRVSLNDTHPQSQGKQVYNYSNNTFYTVELEKSEMRLINFTISNFKKSNSVSSGFSKEYQIGRLLKFKTNVYGTEYLEKLKESSSNLNLIERIMLNVSTPILIQESRSRDKNFSKIANFPRILRALILSHSEKQINSFNSQLEETRSQGSGKDLEDSLLKFFKYPNSTYLTSTLFNLIQVNLNRGLVLITAKKGEANLQDQYSFYFLLKIMKANFDALNLCGVSLTEIIKQKDAYSDFQEAYRSSVVRIIEKGFNTEFEAGPLVEEMKALWKEIYGLCLEILQSSISLIYADTKEVVINLQKNMANITNEKQAENCSISLNYLAIPETSSKLFVNDTAQIDAVKAIFKQCCEMRVTKSAQMISSIVIQSDEPMQDSIDNILQSSNRFIKTFSEQAIIQYCALSETVSSKQGQTYKDSDSDKQKLKTLEIFVSFIFEKIAGSIIQISQSFVNKLEEFFNQATVENAEINATQYYKFADFIDQAIQYNISFFPNLILYVQTFSVFKPKISLIEGLTKSINRIITIISHFYQVLNSNKDKASIDLEKDDLQKFLNQVVNSLVWFQGSTAFKLIKVKDDPLPQKDGESVKVTKNTKEAEYDMIIQSNLLSGGLQTRFLGLFTGESQSQLNELIKISQDKNLLNQVQSAQINVTEDDKLLLSIIHKNSNPHVDRVITYLQQLLERKVPMVPYARLSGEDGMRLSRATFAVMVMFSNEGIDKFSQMVDEVDMQWADLEKDDDREFKIKDYIKTTKSFEPFHKKWETASKMRQWVNEKKKNLIEKIKKTVEVQYLKDLDTKRQQPEPEVVQIDTSSKDTQTFEKSVTQSGLSEEDKANIEDIADKKYMSELNIIYDKIIEKAEFLIKLNVPESFKIKDNLSNKVGGLLFIRNIQSMENIENTVGAQNEFTWRDRLKNWKQMQTSKGAINSFTDKRKEIFESSTMSILACLQTPISSQRIKKQVETVFLNATKRIAGLKIIADLIQLELPQDVRISVISWFTSGLRGNKNILTHYLEDLKGCGEGLEDVARENFFAIIRSLVKHLKHSTNIDEIKTLVNSLKWKYAARDHGQLRGLELFKILHEGNGQPDSLLKKVWGKNLEKKVIANESEKSLQKDVLALFEQIFLLTIGRIVQTDSNNQIKLKSGSGTAIPTLMKAQSFLDENMSEYLVAQSFEVIFKELATYSNLMKEFRGMDWQDYVRIINLSKKTETNPHADKQDLDVLNPSQQYRHDISEESLVEKESIDDDENSYVNQTRISQRDQEFLALHQSYNEDFLNRLLRLVDIFTSIASTNPYPMQMVQRVATPYQIEILLSLILNSSPRQKIASLKIIENLIKLQLPYEIFEETIKIFTREKIPQQIMNETLPKVDIQGSKFIQFLFNYVIRIRNKMWSQSGIESHGSYAVSQEVITLFKSIYESAPQEELQNAIKNKLKAFLTSSPSTWNVEETDILLSILPAGSFTRLMIGSQALYKETQLCVILGFSDKVKEEQDLGILENDILAEVNQSMYCTQPSKEKALVLFVGDGSQTFIPEVRALDISSLYPIPTTFKTSQKSILYDNEVLQGLMKILQEEIQEGSSLALRQAQVQILKIITFLVESEAKQDGHSNFLMHLQEQNMIKDFFTFLQRNANVPEIKNKGDLNLPVELLELYLTSLRMRTLETNMTLLPVASLKASISNNDSITFFEQNQANKEGSQSFLKSISVISSINESSLLQKTKSTAQIVSFFDALKQDPIRINEVIQILVVDGADLKSESNQELLIQALVKANILIVDDALQPEQIYFILKRLSSKITSQSHNLHLKPVFQVTKGDLAQVIDRKVLEFKTYEGQAQKLQAFTSDLQAWGGFTEEQVKMVNDSEAKEDDQVKEVLKMIKKVQDSVKDEGQQSNIKKLLVGKMASLGRRQNSVTSANNAVFEDIGAKIWSESFKDLPITTIIEKFYSASIPPKSSDSKSEERAKAFVSALSAKISDEDILRDKYTSTLNKILRLKSRSALLSFLEYMNPLPIEVLNNLTSLDKLLLLSFNEGINIKNLTGDKQFLKQVKSLIERIFKEPKMKDFIVEFLANQIIKPSQIVIKKVFETKEFLSKGIFESEVDAQMFPLPSFLSSIIKIALTHVPELFNQIRGLLPNVVSILFAFTFARCHTDVSLLKNCIKSLEQAASLLTYVRTNMTTYKYTEDVCNLSFLAELQAKFTSAKISYSKQNEQVKLYNEIYYEWLQIRSQFKKLQEQTTIINFIPKVQNYKFQKKINYLKTKDALLRFNLDREGPGCVSKVHEKIDQQDQKFNSHPGEYRVPFIAKFKGLNGSEAVLLNLNDHTGVQNDDQFFYYADKEGKSRLGKASANQETFITDSVYVTYQQTKADQFYAFGQTKRGRLTNNEKAETMKDALVFSDYKQSVIQVSSCKNGTIFLDDTGYLKHCGTIAGMDLSSQYEQRDFAKMKLVAAGKRNIAAVSDANNVYFYGGAKNNHYATSAYESSNWYKAPWKTPLDSGDNIVDISSGNHFTVVVTSLGFIYGCGEYIMNQINKQPHEGGEAKMTKLDLPEQYKALNVWCSKAKYSQALILSVQHRITKEHYLMSIGNHMCALLGNGKDSDNTQEFQILDYDYKTIEFTKVSLLTNHALAVTKSGELYGWGSNVNGKLGLSLETVMAMKPTPISYFNDKSKFRVIDVACGDEHSFVHVEEFDDLGNSSGFRLYQLGYNPDESEHNYRGATKEELEASNGITRLSKYDNLSIQCMGAGHNTSFIYPVTPAMGAKENWVNTRIANTVCPGLQKKGYLHFFVSDGPIQDNVPLDADEEESVKDKIEELEMNQTIHKAAQIADQEEEKGDSPSKAQQKINDDQQRQSKQQTLEERKARREKKLKVIELRKQEILEKDPARKGWHFYTQNELHERKETFPSVSIALRHPVPELYLKMEYFKELLDQAITVVNDQKDTRFQDQQNHGILCSETGKAIIGSSYYYSSYKIGEDLKEINLSEQAFSEPTTFDYLPLVYFRLAHPLKEGQKLPVADLSKLYKKDSDFKFEFKVKANFLYFTNKQVLSNIFTDQELDMYKKCYQSIFKSSDIPIEKQIVQCFQLINENKLSNLDKEFWDKKKELLKFIKDGKSDDLDDNFKYMIAGLKKIVTEENFTQVQLALFSFLFQQTVAKRILMRISDRSLKNSLPDSLPFLRKQLIAQLPAYMKQEIMTSMINNLPTFDRHELTIRRRKAQAFKDTGACDHEGIHTIFGQIMQVLKKSPDSRKCFKQNSVDSQIFKVEFKGEGSIDAGGPYRETLTNICQELQSSVLPLLIPTPNNKNNHGQYRECWMVNPSATSPAHLEMFMYFGHYIGAAIRSSQALPLDLAPIFWKLIIDEPETESDAQRELDLKGFDTYSWQVIEDLRTNTKDLSDEDFEACIDEQFITLLSNGTQVDLVPGGGNVKVTKQNLEEYLRLLVKARLNESQKQMKAVKQGIDFVLSLNICKFLNSEQLESRATGSKTLDLAKLKQMTSYEGCSSTDPHCVIFWEVMESFNDEERSMYLKFVWGRARLPASSSQNHKLTSLTYVANACLPISHTCFFTLDLPRYPTFEIARDRIYFAIRYCGDIDADRSGHDIGSDD